MATKKRKSKAPGILPAVITTTLSPNKPLYKGWLFKRGDKINRSWQRRWFVLYEDKTVDYFKEQCTSDTPPRDKAKGTIYLKEIHPEIQKLQYRKAQKQKAFKFKFLSAFNPSQLGPSMIDDDQMIDNDQYHLEPETSSDFPTPSVTLSSETSVGSSFSFSRTRLTMSSDEGGSFGGSLGETEITSNYNEMMSDKPYSFVLIQPNTKRDWILAAENKIEMDQWIKLISKACNSPSIPRAPIPLHSPPPPPISGMCRDDSFLDELKEQESIGSDAPIIHRQRSHHRRNRSAPGFSLHAPSKEYAKKELDAKLVSELDDIIDDVLNPEQTNFTITTCNDHQSGSNQQNSSKGDNNNSNKGKEHGTSDNHGGNGGGGGGCFGGGASGDDNRRNSDGDKKEKRRGSKEDEKENEEEEDKKDDEEEEIEDEDEVNGLNVNAAEFSPNLETIQEEEEEKKEDMPVLRKQSNKGRKGRNKRKGSLSNFMLNKFKEFSYEPNSIYFKRGRGAILMNKRFTKQIIPGLAKEKIYELFDYIDKSIAIHQGDEYNNGRVRIFNFDFHDKNTNEVLYCVATKHDPKTNRDFPWRMEENLYHETDDRLKMHTNHLPKSSRFFKFGEMQIILNTINNISKLRGIINKTPWCNIPIFGGLKVDNKRRVTLSLSKSQFEGQLRSFAVHHHNQNDEEISNELIPILMFDDREYDIHYIWIVNIDQTTNTKIGISFKSYDDDIYVTGIHIDKLAILKQHQLVKPQHDCRCLDGFHSYFNEFKIGNPDLIKNQLKDLQTRWNKKSKENKMLSKENNQLKLQLAALEKQLLLQNTQLLHVQNASNQTNKSQSPNPSMSSTETSISNGMNNINGMMSNVVSNKANINNQAPRPVINGTMSNNVNIINGMMNNGTMGDNVVISNNNNNNSIKCNNGISNASVYIYNSAPMSCAIPTLPRAASVPSTPQIQQQLQQQLFAQQQLQQQLQQQQLQVQQQYLVMTQPATTSVPLYPYQQNMNAVNTTNIPSIPFLSVPLYPPQQSQTNINLQPNISMNIIQNNQQHQ